MKRFVLAVTILTAICFQSLIAAESKSHEQALRNWQSLRFGLFVHWGPVSLKGTEIGWSRGGERRGYGKPGTEIPVEVYDNLYKTFNPILFNAFEWVKIAQSAGMKYLVFTSRHHDGFSMFDTQASEYKITNPESPFRRDVVAELADACHRKHLRFGLYYSQPNWQNADAFTPDRHDRYLDFLKTQVRELTTNYGHLDILWFDGLGKTAVDYDAVQLNRIARENQPHLLINNRNGLPEDFDTPEQEIGKFQRDRPWESCITICRQWAWKPDDQLKSLAECIQTLIYCAGGDGNLLLNVGPMPDGRIEPRQVTRLKEIGDWLKKYGEGIYGTRGGPFMPGSWGASTCKGNQIYLFILKWPVVLPKLNAPILDARLMHGKKINLVQKDKIEINLPPAKQQPIVTVLKLKIAGDALALPLLKVEE